MNRSVVSLRDKVVLDILSNVGLLWKADPNNLKSSVCFQLVGTRFSSGLQKDEPASPEVSFRPRDGPYCHGQPQGAEGHPHSAEDSQAPGVSCEKLFLTPRQWFSMGLHIRSTCGL